MIRLRLLYKHITNGHTGIVILENLINMLRPLVLFLVVQYGCSQDLNIIPNLLRPYLRNAEPYTPINLMANISEKLFHAHKIGLKFGMENKCLFFEYTNDKTL